MARDPELIMVIFPDRPGEKREWSGKIALTETRPGHFVLAWENVPSFGSMDIELPKGMIYRILKAVLRSGLLDAIEVKNIWWA